MRNNAVATHVHTYKLKIQKVLSIIIQNTASINKNGQNFLDIQYSLSGEFSGYGLSKWGAYSRYYQLAHCHYVQ